MKKVLCRSALYRSRQGKYFAAGVNKSALFSGLKNHNKCSRKRFAHFDDKKCKERKEIVAIMDKLVLLMLVALLRFGCGE